MILFEDNTIMARLRVRLADAMDGLKVQATNPESVEAFAAQLEFEVICDIYKTHFRHLVELEVEA